MNVSWEMKKGTALVPPNGAFLNRAASNGSMRRTSNLYLSQNRFTLLDDMH